jgi:hypothetical protein
MASVMTSTTMKSVVMMVVTAVDYLLRKTFVLTALANVN